MWTYVFLFSLLIVAGETLVPHSGSVMSLPLRMETPARFISMSASSTLLSRWRYRSMIAVSNEIPLRRGTLSVTSPDVVVRFLL
ncbi:putative D-3-phosphoglycerate dehydrogenase [Oscillibacter valericigenes Sjm18-20]|nr:putative D-3-phosphoglycerate dehydrogenase [Oscillibacter valericigenes Sjm18-20]